MKTFSLTLILFVVGLFPVTTFSQKVGFDWKFVDSIQTDRFIAYMWYAETYRGAMGAVMPGVDQDVAFTFEAYGADEKLSTCLQHAFNAGLLRFAEKKVLLLRSNRMAGNFAAVSQLKEEIKGYLIDHTCTGESKISKVGGFIKGLVGKGDSDENDEKSKSEIKAFNITPLFNETSSNGHTVEFQIPMSFADGAWKFQDVTIRLTDPCTSENDKARITAAIVKVGIYYAADHISKHYPNITGNELARYAGKLGEGQASIQSALSGITCHVQAPPSHEIRPVQPSYDGQPASSINSGRSRIKDQEKFEKDREAELQRRRRRSNQ